MARTPWSQMARRDGFEDWFTFFQGLRHDFGLDIQAAKTPVPTSVMPTIPMLDDTFANRSELADEVREILGKRSVEDQLIGQLTWALPGTDENPLAIRDADIFWHGLKWTPRQTAATNDGRYPADVRTIRASSDAIVFDVARIFSKRARKPKPESELLRAYLQEVIAKNNFLLVGDANRSSIATELVSVGNSMTLSSVWTELRVALQPASDHESSVESKTDKLEVVDALERDEFRQVVLLGTPGAGKSSVVAHEAVLKAEQSLKLRRAEDMTVPIHVRLGDLEVSDPVRLDDMWSGIRERTSDVKDADALRQLLEPHLAAGRALTLFDGLDEVQEEALGGVMELLRLFRQSYADHRMVVTCRAFDYTLPAPNRKLSLPTLHLLPFALDQQLEYLDNWYRRLGEINPDLAGNERKQSLKDSLNDSKDLQKIGGTPLHLALMAVVHTNKGELPENRALLYSEIVRYLLAESPEWRAKNPETRAKHPGQGLAELDDLMLAGRVGYEVHRAQEAATGEFRGLPIQELHRVVQDHLGQFEFAIGTLQYKAREREVSAQVERLVQSNGLLVDQGKQVYNFAFKQCREFLAGVHLSATLGDDDFSIPLAQRPHWREPFRLLASWAPPMQPNIDYILSFIDDLGDSGRGSDFNADDPILAGEMLAEVGKDRLARRPKLLMPTDRTRGLDGLWPRTVARLRPLVDDSGLPVSSRVRAADALGELGDPRFVDAAGQLLPLVNRLVALPATVLTVGSAGMEHEALHEPVNSEPRELTFREFRIGRYPVTNVEYAEFVEDGGYKDARWWPSADADAWRRGDPAFIEELERSWLETAEQDYAPELADGSYTLDSLAETGRDLCRARSAPYFWELPRFSGPTQPVVGVNFWEARAYCLWATDRGRDEGWLSGDDEVRLPTEWEWERAARALEPEAQYPWGDEWSPDQSHTKLDSSHLFRASPVGCFPPASDEAPYEMAGNVWEWTASRLLSYEPEFDADREKPEGVGSRAVRGSSWYDNDPIPNTRSSSRCIDLPGNVYKDAGFRLVVDRRGSIAYSATTPSMKDNSR